MRNRLLRSGLSGVLLASFSLPAAVAKTKEKKPVFKDQYLQVSGLRLHCVTAGAGLFVDFLGTHIGTRSAARFILFGGRCHSRGS